MAKAPAKKKRVKKEKPKVVDRSVKVSFLTPVGTFIYPSLMQPDTGREYSDNKFKISIMWSEAEWEKVSKPFENAVLKCAREACKVDKIRLDEFANPFKLGNDRDKPGIYEDKVYITAKTDYDPKVFGPEEEKWDRDQIAKIKGGDMGRLQVVIYPYTQSGGGVTCGLQKVQYWKPGEAIGGGEENLLTKLEVPLKDLPKDEDEEAHDDSEEVDEEYDEDEVDDDDDLEDF